MNTNDNQKSNSIKNWAEDDRPREKLLHKGYAALSDAELIAILIQSGTREKSAVDLAREIMQLGNHNLSRLGKLHLKDFQKIKGIGEARAITLVAALELGRRRQLSEGVELLDIHTSRSAADILIPLLGDLPQEKFCVLFLTNTNRLIRYEFVSSGGLVATVVDMKLIFKSAIQCLASRIILAHNHPSGSLKPSEHDQRITAELKAGAQLLELRLTDHLIIADTKYFSFADAGMM